VKAINVQIRGKLFFSHIKFNNNHSIDQISYSRAEMKSFQHPLHVKIAHVVNRPPATFLFFFSPRFPHQTLYFFEPALRFGLPLNLVFIVLISIFLIWNKYLFYLKSFIKLECFFNFILLQNLHHYTWFWSFFLLLFFYFLISSHSFILFNINTIFGSHFLIVILLLSWFILFFNFIIRCFISFNFYIKFDNYYFYFYLFYF
jgi:hypothetical protein